VDPDRTNRRRHADTSLDHSSRVELVSDADDVRKRAAVALALAVPESVAEIDSLTSDRDGRGHPSHDMTIRLLKPLYTRGSHGAPTLPMTRIARFMAENGISS